MPARHQTEPGIARNIDRRVFFVWFAADIPDSKLPIVRYYEPSYFHPRSIGFIKPNILMIRLIARFDIIQHYYFIADISHYFLYNYYMKNNKVGFENRGDPPCGRSQRTRWSISCLFYSRCFYISSLSIIKTTLKTAKSRPNFLSPSSYPLY